MNMNEYIRRGLKTPFSTLDQGKNKSRHLRYLQAWIGLGAARGELKHSFRQTKDTLSFSLSYPLGLHNAPQGAEERLTLPKVIFEG